ncbi:MAG TPA: hypothetical protein DCS93_36780 [Microscillaceae bacterium]|nr:hypothetical protein [Microscillaceae bacterium]
MTTVIGMLNKKGIALAADSAVTITRGSQRKVYNTANKIFALSKYNPIGVAIYNGAEFMGTPWEILIKEYRRQITEKSFTTLEEYKKDFFNWLKLNDYFTNEEKSRKYLNAEFAFFVQEVIISLKKTVTKTTVTNEILEKEFEKAILRIEKNFEVLENFKDFSGDRLKDLLKNEELGKATKLLSNAFQIMFALDDLLIEMFHAYVIRNGFILFTGLVFSGYGTEDLFPQLLPVNVSLVIDEQLRYCDDKDKEIRINADSNIGNIASFAQTDVANTILHGISPWLDKVAEQTVGKVVSKLVSSQLGGMSNAAMQKLKDTVSKEFRVEIDEGIKRKYTNPFLSALGQLSNTDLAEMSESLVYLTCLKRRFTLAEENVGGPVDVAVITKDDGFVWVKKK